jgi:transposase-like protein
MGPKSMSTKNTAEKAVRDILRKTRKQYCAEEKIRIVLEGLRGEESIASLCRREGVAESLHYSWSKAFLEAGKKRLSGETSIGSINDLFRNCTEYRQVIKPSLTCASTQCWPKLRRWADTNSVFPRDFSTVSTLETIATPPRVGVATTGLTRVIAPLSVEQAGLGRRPTRG